MSNIIQNGASTTVNLQTGEKLAVSAIDGTFSAVIRAGVGVGTALATNALGGEYGPYVSPVVIQVSSSADGLVDFEVGAVPSLDYREPVTAVSNPLTGGISLLAGANDALKLAGLHGGDVYVKPAAFDWTPPVTVYRVGSEIKTSFDRDTWLNPTSATAWVNVATGNDTTGNGAYATPYKSINKAITMLAADTTIYVVAGIYDRNNCWKAISPQYNVNVIAVGGEVFSSMRWEGGSWTLTTSGTYAATRSTVGMVVDMAALDSDGLGQRLKKVASQALCEAEVGTWATDNVSVWVHTADARSPDSNVLVMIDLTNGHIAHDKRIYCRGITFEGGLSGGFAATSALLTANSCLVFDACRFRYSKLNGLTATGIGLVISNKCIASGNLADGFNYHQGGNAINVMAVELDCASFGNGDPTDTSDNDNASTAHEACRVVRVRTLGKHTSGPLFADIDQSMSWNIGCTALDSTAPTRAEQRTGFQALGTAKMWLDGCYSSGNAYGASTGATANIYARSSVADGVLTASNVALY